MNIIFIEGFCNALEIKTEGKDRFSNIDELSQNRVASGLGVEFAALATIISQFLSVVFCMKWLC